jgi:hypothetical protein
MILLFSEMLKFLKSNSILKRKFNEGKLREYFGNVLIFDMESSK